MGCSAGVGRGAEACGCVGQTVFEGAVIGQVFTGNVHLHCLGERQQSANGADATVAFQHNSTGVNGMRATFPGYFDPTEADVNALWRDGVISLDTNVLLGLYRMPAASRQEIFELLSNVRERLWIPYHVLVEFHRNRLDTMRDEFAAAKQLGKDARIAYDAFKAVVSNQRVQERACWTDLSAMLAEMNAKADELIRVTKSESQHYISPNAPDSVLAFVEELLNGRTGSRPAGQEQVARAESEARDRYLVKMGPGFSDQEKAGDLYMFDGLTYDRQYGDYMVWQELLERCAAKKVPRLLLVTSDVKVDWWLDSRSISGKRPQPELVMEMRRRAGVETFWMYTLSDFIENAKHHLQAHITQKAITDARQAEAAPRRDAAIREDVASRSLGAVTGENLRTVLNGFAKRVLHVSEAVSVGVTSDSIAVTTGVAVVSGDHLLAMPSKVGSKLHSAVELIELFQEVSALDVYVVFRSPKQEELFPLAMVEIRRLLDRMRLGFKTTVYVGSFVNKERTEYMFGT